VPSLGGSDDAGLAQDIRAQDARAQHAYVQGVRPALGGAPTRGPAGEQGGTRVEYGYGYGYRYGDGDGGGDADGAPAAANAPASANAMTTAAGGMAGVGAVAAVVAGVGVSVGARRRQSQRQPQYARVANLPAVLEDPREDPERTYRALVGATGATGSIMSTPEQRRVCPNTGSDTPSAMLPSGPPTAVSTPRFTAVYTISVSFGPVP
jgi:hypothetical protein